MTADSASILEAAQRAAGIIAAKHRGDCAGSEQLLAEFPDEASRTERRGRRGVEAPLLAGTISGRPIVLMILNG